jgi:Potential Queuosine, Q, salvage protein family
MVDVEETSLPERVRTACAWVVERARSVAIEPDAIAAYAATLPGALAAPSVDPATELVEGDRETRTAFAICIDAINFGSGWWPTIRKRPGRSGYFTVAAALTERFRDRGAWAAAELATIGPAEVAAVLGQDADHPLMADYATALREVGERIRDEHGGSFEAVAEAAGGSAVAMAELLSAWRAFADVSEYDGQPVPFFKRAQIAAADLARMGLADFGDLDRLTAFADNLVPHVLRVDGLMRLDPALEARIEAGKLLEHGAAEEVELRACTVHAVELLAAATDGHRSPTEIDAILWNRGSAERYKSLPRPRSRNTAY